MASEAEAVVIPIEVPVQTSGLDAARAKLRDAETDLRAFKESARVPTAIEVQVSEAKARVADLKNEVKALEKANREANAAAVKGFQYQKEDEAKKAAESEAFYERAGSFLSSGATAVLSAAAAIAAASAGLVVAGLKLGIEGTAQKEKNIAVLDRLTKGQGEIAESVSKSLAAETGVGEDKAIERVKALIQAKFNRPETETVFKASADIGAALGEGKADTFLAILEKVQHEGTATEKALKGLSGVGLDRSAVLEGLRQTGETVEMVEARLKSGKVAASDFAKAASAAAQKDFGGIAGKDLDAAFNRAKIAAEDLFDGMDDGLSAVKDLGGLLTDALSGASGAKLKEQISAAGNSVLELTKNITKADIESAFKTVGSAATTAAGAIKTAAGYAGDLWNVIKQVSGSGSHKETIDTSDPEERDAFLRNKAFNDRLAAQQEAAAKAKADAEAKGGEAGPTAKTEDAAKGGISTGKAYADGLAKGIAENADKPAAAAAAAMAGTIDAGKAKAQIKSPSRVTEEDGKNLEEGRARGIERNAGKPAAAAEESMRRTLRAGGSGGAASASGGSSSPGGGNVNITIGPFTLPPGSNEETKEAARAGVTMAIPQLLAALRTVGKLGGVAGGPSLP